MRGICFKEFMFRAVVSGIKTTTYRTGNLRYFEGETIYLKEPYFRKQNSILYKFDTQNIENEKEPDKPWKNKLFMPQSAARYFIKVTSVLHLHLKLLFEDDFIDEGIQQDADGFHYGTDQRFKTDKEAFINLWNSINGSGAYDLNPLVWLYRFELIKK